MTRKHLKVVSKTPLIAQSNFGIKLENTTEIIDRLLLVPRQAPWKAIGTGSGGGDIDTDTDVDTDLVDEEL